VRLVDCLNFSAIGTARCSSEEYPFQVKLQMCPQVRTFRETPPLESVILILGMGMRSQQFMEGRRIYYKITYLHTTLVAWDCPHLDQIRLPGQSQNQRRHSQTKVLPPFYPSNRKRQPPSSSLSQLIEQHNYCGF
jgi:hypothetical protein